MTCMEICFAPMEGITGHIYRRVHHEIYGDSVDRYFTPFIAATYTKSYKTREKEDARPENNAGIATVPQILSNDAGEFLHAAGWLHEMGYREINLNLGCPVSTVVSKNRGAGFLRVPEKLDAFLDEVFRDLPEGMRLSVKTRIGFSSPEEAPSLFAMYKEYPISELIIHPRTRNEMYSGLPHLETFALAADLSAKIPVCYNGNVNTAEDLELIRDRFDWIHAVMIGRGLIADPALALKIKGRDRDTPAPGLRVFHKAIYAAYKEVYLSPSFKKNADGRLPVGQQGRTGAGASGERVLVNRMKELWAYMGRMYPEGERYLKEIRKARNCVEYEAAVRMLMNNCAEEKAAPRGFM